MSRRSWWTVGGVVVIVAVVVAVFGIIKATRHATSDCDTVHAMIDYNKQFNKSVEQSANSGDPSGSTEADYQKWAAQLHDYAGRIRDPQLTEPATAVAGLADQMVEVVPKVRAESTAPSAHTPPSVVEYGRIGRDFKDNFAKLNQACPA